MIIDSFLFFQELKLLKVRLDYLYDVVDKFLIVEAGESFSGKKKEYIFEKNKRFFEKYTDKIIYFKIKDNHKNYKSLINYLNFKKEYIYENIKNFMESHNHYNKKEKHFFLDSYH
ncbi:MAG: hypothetical protein CMM96_05870, partial [Rickettsiales bacterium]|nr:hypothetical protein [Rickettsiales bacterium]